jgi:DNA end-binding protein Ku
LCALVSVGDGIIMNTLRYATEIRNPEDLKLPGHSGITDKELKMALSLVEEMSEKWNPKGYHDTYREDVLKLVEKKVKAGQTHTLTEPTGEAPVPKASNVVDLVALLKQSLGSKGRSATAATEEEEDEEAAAPRAPRARRSTSTAASKTRSTSSSRSTSAAKPAAKRTSAAKSSAKSTSTRRKAA